jgi:CRISPR system Cascade subunit CasE
MYLSKLVLNPRNAKARRDLASPYEMHRTLATRAYPDGEPEANRLLFRVEPPQPGQRGRTVLVQASEAAPDVAFAHEMSEGGAPYALDVRPPKAVSPTLVEGQRLAFRLLGNATKKRDGKRIALTDEAAYHGWLDRKARQSGFDVLFAHAAPFWINEHKLDQDDYAKSGIPHFAVRYDGLLHVRHPDRLGEALAAGVGPAKAFGFGLLTVARPRR